jgi:hypothetical protein
MGVQMAENFSQNPGQHFQDLDGSLAVNARQCQQSGACKPLEIKTVVPEWTHVSALIRPRTKPLAR